MNLAETARLLAYAATVDNRRVDDATVVAWQGILGDLPYPESVEAVRRHFARSTEYLVPAHVRVGVLEIRNEHRGHSEPLALPSRFEPDDERTARVRRGIAACVEALSLVRERRPQVAVEELSPSDQLRERAIERARRERLTRRSA